jgi:hypothetical protein
MTCQECELLLAAGGNAPEHLMSCAACRELAEDLRANTEGLMAMRDEAPFGPVRPSANRWVWIAAAAAALVVALALSRTAPHAPAPPVKIGREILPAVGTAAPPERDRAQRTPLARGPARPPSARPVVVKESAPLVVKMLTPDPDVVIYWLIDAKEGP